MGPLGMAQDIGKELFNEDWQFFKGDLSLEEIDQAGVSWRPVAIPHDWSVEGPFSSKWASGTGYLPGGVGWYKKTFDLDIDKAKKYAIYFDGIYKNSEVWINGNYLGKRPNGFLPIQYDLTPYLKNEDNVILVKADHTDYADSRYYTGSGLYRNVYFITNEKQHFSQWGVFFHTPSVSKQQATALLEIEIDNHDPETKNSQIQAVLKSDKGNTIASAQTSMHLRSGKENYTELSFEVLNPELWSPDTPNLYNLEVRLLVDGNQVDVWQERVGFRDFYFDADEGFFLNEENMLIKGVCIHQDAGALGAAVPKEVWAERLRTLKELGANALRMAHYPHQDYLYELADEIGFLVQDEAFDEWEFGKNKWIEGWNVGNPGHDGYHVDFARWGQRDVQDMIRRNRNHPSIFMWSIGNEIDYPNDPYSHPVLDEGRNPQIYGRGYQPNNPPASHLAKLATELVMAAKMYDTTRPVTAALAGVTMSNHTDYPAALDIVGYNYQEYRYVEDHLEYPQRVIYGSENGDGLDAWLAVVENDFISSQFLWTAFDFLGEAREWPVRSSGAGIIDLAGKPKPDFYFRKSLWNDEPMVFIGVAQNERDVLRRSNLETAWIGNQGETKWITAYANTDQVELFLNGKSLGKKDVVYSTDKMISWEVPYVKGELVLKGYNEGTAVAQYQLNTPGEPVALQVKASKTDFVIKQKDIVLIDLLLVDAHGNRVTDNDREVEVQISGPAVLLGMESGDLSSHEDYKSNRRNTYKGRLRAYVQTEGETGSINVKISSAGFATQELSLAPEK